MDVLDRLLRAGFRRLGMDRMMSAPAYAVTVGTRDRLPVFDDIAFGRECARLLRDACDRTGVGLAAYCLMPDHACLILRLESQTTLPAIVNAWKTLCAQARRQRGGAAPFWERGYAERELPGTDALRLAARYVLEKPVRAGLVRGVRDYPLSGPFDPLVSS